jgi:MFS family permease
MKNYKPSNASIITAVCFGIQAVGVGTYVSFGIFFNPLISEFGWTRATISGASSLAFFIMGLLGIFIGRLNDRIGPRKMMTATAIIFGVGHLLMSRLEAIWQLYLFYGVIVGTGLSSIDIIALSTIARWFTKKRGLMTGIVKVGTGAGQFTIPLVTSLLITFYGWRTAYMVIGGSVLIILVLIAQLLKRNPGPFGASDLQNNIEGDKTERTEEGFTRKEAFRTLQFWIICASNLMAVFCFMMIIVHIAPLAQDTGISFAKAAGVLSTIGGVSIVGRLITGICIDRIGSKKLMSFCFILLIIGLIWLLIAERVWMLYVFAGIYGLAHGGYFTAISPIVAEYFGIRAHGALFGIVVFFGALGGTIGPIAAGYIFDVTGTYGPALWLSTFMGVAGLVSIIMLKPVKL